MDTILNKKQKAVAAAVVTFLTSLATSLLTALEALGDGAVIGDLSQAAWLTVIVSVLGSTGVVTGVVYSVPNRQRYGGHDMGVEDGAYVLPDDVEG